MKRSIWAVGRMAVSVLSSMSRFSGLTKWYMALAVGAIATLAWLYIPFLMSWPRIDKSGEGIIILGMSVLGLSAVSLPTAFFKSSPLRGQGIRHERLVAGLSICVIVLYSTWVVIVLYSLAHATDL
jgi:hypothetical protein